MYENEIISRITFVDDYSKNVLMDTTDIEVFKKYFENDRNIILKTHEIVNLNGNEFTIEWFSIMITKTPMECPLFFEQKCYPYSLRVMVYLLTV